MNKTNTKKSTLRRSAFGLLALVTAFVAETAFAGAWSCQRLTESNPLAKSVNLLRGRQPTASSRGYRSEYPTADGAAFSAGYAKRFTDGDIQIGDGYWGEFIGSAGAYVCYSVADDPAGVALASVRFTTTHFDKGRSQVRIAKLSVQKAGQGGWIELEHSSIIGPKPQEGETNFQAVYAETDGRPIAEDVTAIRLDFDAEQQNDGVGFGEIEATAFCAPGTWTCRPQTAARALLPSANVLRGMGPAVSSDTDGTTSVTYSALRNGGLALGSVRVTSTAADGSAIRIGSVQVKTAVTGEAWFTLPGSAVSTNAAGVSVWEAFYANPEGQPLVSRVTDLKVVFTPGLGTARPVIEATEAGTANWTCRPLAEANPMPAKENALLGRTATDFNNGVAAVDVQTNLFTDGKIELRKEGWTGRIENGGGFVSYRLCEAGDPNGVRLRNVRVTTTHADYRRSEIRIDSVLVKTRTNGEAWFALPNANIVGPDVPDNVGDENRLPNNQATYARADGAFLVLDATDLRIEFCVEQQNGWVGISEIEAACKPYRGLAVIIR